MMIAEVQRVRKAQNGYKKRGAPKRVPDAVPTPFDAFNPARQPMIDGSAKLLAAIERVHGGWAGKAAFLGNAA